VKQSANYYLVVVLDAVGDTGALCGLGQDALPDHDIDINFDIQFDKEDLNTIIRQILGQGRNLGQGQILRRGQILNQGRILGQGQILGQGYVQDQGQCVCGCIWLRQMSLLTVPMAPLAD